MRHAFDRFPGPFGSSCVWLLSRRWHRPARKLPAGSRALRPLFRLSPSACRPASTWAFAGFPAEQGSGAGHGHNGGARGSDPGPVAGGCRGMTLAPSWFWIAGASLADQGCGLTHTQRAVLYARASQPAHSHPTPTHTHGQVRQPLGFNSSQVLEGGLPTRLLTLASRRRTQVRGATRRARLCGGGAWGV